MAGFPLISIDIYPFEGSTYTISPQQVLACKITSYSGGSKFTITLTPGGPKGVVGIPSWSEVITPLSTVVIALQRENNSNVVVVGVAENIAETQVWSSNNVTRVIQINGSDISYYFDHFFYTLFPFLQGNSLAYGGATQLGNAINFGILYDRPNKIANDFLGKMMIGSGGVLGETFLAAAGNQVYIRDALYVQLEDLDIQTLPYGENYFSETISWREKFANIMPFPQYELILGTAPSGQWSSGGANAVTNMASRSWSSLGIPQAKPAYTQFIARRLRFPDLTTASSGSYSLVGADTSLWSSLPAYAPASGFINSAINFSVGDTKNFYLLNPVWLTANNGNNSNLYPWCYQFYGYADPASIHRYGYRPWLWDTRWLAVLPNGQPTASSGQLVATAIALSKRLCSYAEPIPVMGKGQITMELRPDIFIGSTFVYQPFRDNINWQFYISSLTHNYVFGGPSTTTLQLERGLPQSIYTNSSTLFNILIGNAYRENGIYTIGLPAGVKGPSLVGFDSSVQAQKTILDEIAHAYVTPQQT